MDKHVVQSVDVLTAKTKLRIPSAISSFVLSKILRTCSWQGLYSADVKSLNVKRDTAIASKLEYLVQINAAVTSVSTQKTVTINTHTHIASSTNKPSS